MSLRKWLAAHPRAVRTCRMLGICIFVVAFFLPAIRDTSSELGSAGTLFGYECARLSLALVTAKDTFQSPFFLAFMSGCINPLILLYLLSSFTRKLARLRQILAVSVLVCMAATWIFFAILKYLPMIGHFLWIAGALMILAPELRGRGESPLVDDGTNR